MSDKELKKEDRIYDVMIIGGGPCGLSAALYSSRGGKKTVVIEKGTAGGQISETGMVENYPGGLLEDTGMALSNRMKEQAVRFGAEFVEDEIADVSLDGRMKKLTGAKGVYEGRSVIIATGVFPRRIEKPGEEEFRGRGVSYCATCDGFFFTGQKVIVVGGGESALEEGDFLTRYAKEVILVHRKDQFTGSAHAQERIRSNEKVRILMNTEVQEIKGDDAIREVVLRNTKTGELTVCRAGEDGEDEKNGYADFIGVFIFAGHIPNSKLFENSVEMNGAGYFITDENMKTNLPGVFAAGDAREKNIRQVITAAADGAIAGVEAVKYTDENFKKI